MRSSRHKNAPCWSATSCLSPPDLLRSTIGARGLNFWVRNGTRCASPAMVADQQGVFLYQRVFSRALRAAQCDVKFKGFKITHQSNILKKRRARPISNARLNALQHLHLHPINLVVYKGSYRRKTHLGMGFPLRCFQRLSRPDSATGQCYWLTTRTPEVRPPRSSRTRGSLPQFPTPTEDRDRTVSRRSEPSSRTALNGEQPYPLGPAPAPGCDEPTSRCQTFPSMWTLGEDQPVIPGVPFVR